MLRLSVTAQPGQLYFPPTMYSYTILDETGAPVKFSQNNAFRIGIDSLWFHPDSIHPIPEPISALTEHEDTLTLLPENQINRLAIFYDQPNSINFIQINDFHLTLSHAISLLKIAHGQDTMYLFQQSETPIELKFAPGYHYFPYWARHFIKELPELSGSAFINADPSHFIISKAAADSLQSELLPQKNAAVLRIENHMADAFLDGFAQIESRVIPMQFMQNPFPYGDGHFESPLYATQEENVYIAMMEYYMRENNCTSYKDFFTRIDLNNNKIEHWFPQDNPQKFGSHARYFLVDTFNQVIYLKMAYRTDTQTPIVECGAGAAYQNIMYRSYDGGKNWEEDQQYTRLFNEITFYKFQFLDRNYAMGYSIQKIKNKRTNSEMDQGVYYLIKNGNVTETFFTPKDIPFNTNYANYHFSRGYGDTAFLGSWGYNPYNHKESDVHHLYTVKKNATWVFEIGSADFKRSQHYRKNELKKEYRNFIIAGDTLFFKNGAKMIHHLHVTENPAENGLIILEQDTHIYLINTMNHVMYISFDAGLTWLFYPKIIEKPGEMLFPGIDSDYTISLFNYRQFLKKTYRFVPAE